MGNNKSKIDKLKALQDVRVTEPDEMVSLRNQLHNVIKLNEELTAENARLLTDCDALNEHIGGCNDMYDNQIVENLEITESNKRLCEQVDHLTNKIEKIGKERRERQINYLSLCEQLQIIKSKWWYKLMMWEW